MSFFVDFASIAATVAKAKADALAAGTDWLPKATLLLLLLLLPLKLWLQIIIQRL
jgi:hypothetical protein